MSGVGEGALPSVDAACKAIVRGCRTHMPDPNSTAATNRSYAAYRRVYEAHVFDF